MGQREGWWNLALVYDMVDRPGESFSALRQSARQGDIDGIMRYSNWLWEDGGTSAGDPGQVPAPHRGPGR